MTALVQPRRAVQRMAVIDWWSDEFPKLTRFARTRYTPDDAEDVASEAVLRGLEAERQGTTVTRNYVRQVAHNLLVDLYRHQERVHKAMDRYERLPVTQPAIPGDDLPTDLLDGLDLTDRQRQAIAGLMRGDRQVEIADDLGVHKRRIWDAQHAVFRKLRRKMAS